MKESTKPGEPEKVAEPPKAVRHPNDGLGLEAFNYREMRGKKYHDYIDLVEGKVMDEDDPEQRRGGGLPGNKQFLFDVYYVKPIFKRLYPLSKTDKTTVLNGFELEKEKPVTVGTRMFMDQIHGKYGLNKQLEAKIVSGGDLKLSYYLLQQPKTV